MITFSETCSNIEQLLRVLNRFSEIKVSLSDKSEDGQRLIILLDFRPKVQTITTKAKFADRLAKMLGNAHDYDAFASNVGISWVGNKGVNGENEPFIILEIPLDGIESVTDIIVQHRLEFIKSPSYSLRSKYSIVSEHSHEILRRSDCDNPAGSSEREKLKKKTNIIES